MAAAATKRKAGDVGAAADGPAAKRQKAAPGRAIEVDGGKAEAKKPMSATEALKKRQAAAAAAARGGPAAAAAAGDAAPASAAAAAGAGAGAGAAAAAAARRAANRKDSPEMAAFVALCEAHPEGVRDPDVAAALPHIDQETRLAVVNDLMAQQRLKLFHDQDKTVIYKIVSAADMAKFHGLKASDITIYTLIEHSKTNGIWVKDMRTRTGLSMPEVNKSIKVLTARQLIKCHQIVGDQLKNRRMFVLFDVEPGKDSSSGPWYQGGQFDENFLDALFKGVLQAVKHAGRVGTSPAAVSEVLAKTGVFTVPIAPDDVGHAMLALLYDNKVEVVPSPYQMKYTTGVGAPPLYSDVDVTYRLVRGGVATCEATTIPCTACPVAEQCAEGNVVNPRDCKYYENYLKF